jgi:hypothetical protein
VPRAKSLYMRTVGNREPFHALGWVFLENQGLILHPLRRGYLRTKGGAVWLVVDRDAEAGPERRGRTRSATKRHTQHSKRTIVITETRGRGSKWTNVYEEVCEEEWWPKLPSWYMWSALAPTWPNLAHLNGLEAEQFSRSWDSSGRSESHRLELILVWFRARRYGGARWTCRTYRPACNRAALFVKCSQLDLLSLTFAILYLLSGQVGECLW